jgi:hypothetical protein
MESIAHMNGLPIVQISCAACGVEFDAILYSRGFTDDLEYVCQDCGLIRFVSGYSEAYRYTARKFGHEQVGLYLRNCLCGGQFAYAGRSFRWYRCPNCRAQLGAERVAAALGIDYEMWENQEAHFSNVDTNQGRIEYAEPGLEILGHLVGDPWRNEIEDPGFQASREADRKVEEKEDDDL